MLLLLFLFVFFIGIVASSRDRCCIVYCCSRAWPVLQAPVALVAVLRCVGSFAVQQFVA